MISSPTSSPNSSHTMHLDDIQSQLLPQLLPVALSPLSSSTMPSTFLFFSFFNNALTPSYATYILLSVGPFPGTWLSYKELHPQIKLTVHSTSVRGGSSWTISYFVLGCWLTDLMQVLCRQPQLLWVLSIAFCHVQRTLFGSGNLWPLALTIVLPLVFPWFQALGCVCVYVCDIDVKTTDTLHFGHLWTSALTVMDVTGIEIWIQRAAWYHVLSAEK